MFRNIGAHSISKHKYFFKDGHSSLGVLSGKVITCRLKHSQERDPQFLQRSVVPTMHFQDSLPQLPIPELTDTCRRYLGALEPFVSSDHLQKTKEIVETFRNGDGKDLHEKLKVSNASNKHTSYISEPWFDMYLKSRSPLVLNFNPFLAFKDDPDVKYNTQLLRTTNMLLSALRFMKSLKANLLEPEVFHMNPEKSDTTFFRKTVRLIPRKFSWHGAYLFKVFPLDMSQFGNLFCSTRIPRSGKDSIEVFPDARHMVVLRNGHFYVFDAIDGDGNILPPAHLLNHIRYILSDSRPVPEHPIAVLTSGDRDSWARTRTRLQESGNEESLRLVDSALFVLALDDETFAEDQVVGSAHHMLHGPVHNRWFDKSFTLIVTGDGKAAVNFEHAWGDGVAVLRFFNEVFADSTTNHFVGPKTVPANVDAAHRVRRLDFNLDDSLKADIQTARENVKQFTDKLHLSVMQHPTLNRETIKKSKLSPDSVAQLGFQMAYYKLFGTFVATYESCSTSAFRHGRTETVRPLTAPSRHCVEAFCLGREKPSVPDLKAQLRLCTELHNQLTKEAAMGQGFDRHLFALKMLSEREGRKLPDLYSDPSYAEANHFRLSTSTLFGLAFSGGGFAPVVPDGFGLGYGFMDGSRLACLISAYSSRAGDFAAALQESYDQIEDVLSEKAS